MKIRTITTGVHLNSPDDFEKIQKVADFNNKVQAAFENNGYEVQTTRVATNSWEEYLAGLSDQEVLAQVEELEKIAKHLEVSFFNIGRAENVDKILLLSEIIAQSEIISCSAGMNDSETGILFKNVRAVAEVIKAISEKTENGYGNFRFCGSVNCEPGIPFFPTGFHEGEKSSFGIGLENGDLAMKAFSEAKNIEDAPGKLAEIFNEECSKIEKIAEQVCVDLGPDFEGFDYNGIDVSLNPGLDKKESIALAYEKLGIGKFGEPGTLIISAMITSVLKNLDVKICGYSGLMLPSLEDVGLARRSDEGIFNMTNLLSYSSVCGCGYDTVPVPGDIAVDKLERLLLDVAMLGVKNEKPLSARIFPVPGKKAGDKTNFDSPFLVDCKVMEV